MIRKCQRCVRYDVRGRSLMRVNNWLSCMVYNRDSKGNCKLDLAKLAGGPKSILFK